MNSKNRDVGDESAKNWRNKCGTRQGMIAYNSNAPHFMNTNISPPLLTCLQGYIWYCCMPSSLSCCILYSSCFSDFWYCHSYIFYTCISMTECHAELNAIISGFRRLADMSSCTLYVSDAPCVDCCPLISQSGLKNVVWGRDYRGSDHVKELGDMQE